MLIKSRVVSVTPILDANESQYRNNRYILPNSLTFTDLEGE